MEFSQCSDVTLVVTSCGRFDLLKLTLASFDHFNTAPIREVLITEDSGDDGVFRVIPEHWKPYVRVFVNRPKLGQLASIDKAYSEIATPYIFHCEDDWEFYREGFVEDSMSILDAEPKILQVWLRNYIHDLRIHSSYLRQGDRFLIDGVSCYQVVSDKSDWQGFSLNPGLRRLKDYKLVAPFLAKGSEKALSKHYDELGFKAVMLEWDAVLHTGFDAHVSIPRERFRKARRRYRENLKLSVFSAFFLVSGIGLGVLLG